MSVLDCADVREAAAEFAFGVLDGEARADVVTHLDRCPACRTLVHELGETADSVVLLAPEAEPPPGFEDRVITGLLGTRRRDRWRTVKLVAAVAAAAAIVSVVAVRIVDSSRSTDRVQSAVPVRATVPMVGAGGARVGQVDVVDAGTFASLALRVDYALPDGAYQVVLGPETPARQVLGTMTVAGGHGVWAGTAVLAASAPEIALVDVGGDVPCSAKLPA